MVELNRLIGDGKDMKRTLIFKYDNAFVFYENDELLFKIDTDQLKLDSKIIYEKIFKGVNGNQEINIINNFENIENKTVNSLSNFIYNTVSSLINDICDEIKTQKIFDDKIEG